MITTQRVCHYAPDFEENTDYRAYRLAPLLPLSAIVGSRCKGRVFCNGGGRYGGRMGTVHAIRNASTTFRALRPRCQSTFFGHFAYFMRFQPSPCRYCPVRFGIAREGVTNGYAWGLPAAHNLSLFCPSFPALSRLVANRGRSIDSRQKEGAVELGGAGNGSGELAWTVRPRGIGAAIRRQRPRPVNWGRQHRCPYRCSSRGFPRRAG